MYEEPKKMSKSKKIEIIILIILLLWGTLFLVDYLRYNKSKHPLLSLRVIHNYEDGTTKEYYSFGYIYREYNRNSIKDEEFVPFWHPLKNPAPESSLPKTYSDYNIPKNPYRDDKYKGLLYFYNYSTLIGTYKCINSEDECTKALSGHDEYNINNADFLNPQKVAKMNILYKRYTFVDDSRKQDISYGEPGYFRTIYLLDLTENKIIAQYSDVKASIYNEKDKISSGDENKYIVRHYETKKWGVISISKDGSIKEELAFNYDSINFDEDTGYYILCENEKWFIYDLKNNQKLMEPIESPIYDVWINANKTTYYKTRHTKELIEQIYPTFDIYRLDGEEFLKLDNITVILSDPKYIMYLSESEKIIRFIDYAKETKKEIPLNFTSLEKGEKILPCFELRYRSDRFISLRIYNTSSLGSEYKDISVDLLTWK